jgi:hypothetical protein
MPYEKRWCEAFALACEIDLERIAIEAGEQVKKLTGGIGGID